MRPPDTIAPPVELSERQRAALLSLLADEDPAVYQTVREKILSYGRQAAEWLRPHTLSGDPALRRRALEVVLHFERQEADDRFLAFCLKQGEDLDLEQGVWLFAQTRYPEINVQGYQALLDSYASDMRDGLEAATETTQVLAVVNQHLFGELGFAGNEKSYYDPENSYLNRVMDRRTGNPINLCVFYMLVARRLRLPVTGIGLPGHFICRYQSTAAEVYVDVFNRGKLLGKGDCIHYLLQGKYNVRDDFLAPLSPRRILRRICDNLYQIYQHLELDEEATRVQRYCIAMQR